MRDLIKKLQKIEEGKFSELDIEVKQFKSRKPDATPEEIEAHIRRAIGDNEADYVAAHPDELSEDEIGGFPVTSPQQSYDEFVDYYVQDLSSSIVRKGVFQDLYAAAGNDIDRLNDAIKDEAYSIADSYYGTGEGIGTSDMNHFIQGIGKQLGVDDLFGWYKKKESIEESDEEGINTPELFDREGYHLQVRKGEFMPSDMLDGRVVLHDLENISPGSGNPKIVTFDDLTLAKETAKKFGGMVIRTALKTYRIVPIMKSDEEMERDKAVRAMKANSAIRGLAGLKEDSGHSIFEILADSDVYHLVDDLEYGRFDNNSSYADILYDYYNDEMPYDVATGDYGEPDEWIKDKLMQDYGDEIDDIAQKMAREQLAAIRKNAGLGEAIVKVPRGLRYDDVVSNQDFGMSSDDAEAFINSLGPDDTVSHEVVDPETGELLDWPDRETRRKRNQKEYDRQEKERKEREEKDHEEGYDSPYLYVSGLDKDPERAWEGIQTLKYDREFTDFYNIVWRSVREYAGEPEDLGADTQDWADLDYDVDIDIPVAIKRKDGKKFNKQDRQNFDWISKIFKAATGNIGVHYIGSSDNGTVARFNPTFM